MTTKPTSVYLEHGHCLRLLCMLFFFSSFLTYPQDDNINDLQVKIKAIKKTKLEFEKDTTYISLLNDLAGAYRFIKSDSTYHLSKTSYELSEIINYDNGKILSLKYLGDYYSDKGKFKKAISHYTVALEISKEKSSNYHVLRLLNDLSLEYQYAGDFSKALKTFLEAIELAESSNNIEMLSILYENLAGMYADQKDFDQALFFYERVKKANREIGDEVISAETMSNMAELYSDMGKFEHAMFNANQSILIFEKHKIIDWLAYAYTVKGNIYLKQGKIKWSIYWFDQASALYQKIDDERGEINLYDGYAKAYFELEIDSLSEKFANKSYSIAKKIASLEGQKSGAENLYKVFKKKGDHETALAYHETFQRISDSLAHDENQNSLALIKTQMHHEKRQQELISNNEKAMAKQRNYIYIAIIVLVILLATAIPLYFNQKKLVRLYNELKNKTTTLKEREAELKKIDKTKNQLFSIIGHDLRGPIGGLQGLLNLFANNEIPKSEFDSFIPKLKSDVDHILFSLNNLLSWGQAQLKNNITKPSIIPLKNNVEDSIKLLTENAQKKQIRIINKISGSAFVWVDSNQLDIIIRNLISNAIKFTPENGTITLDSKQEDDHWKIWVSDTGVGMNKDISSRIFSSEEKVTTFGTNNEKGTGLGLSLCQEMIQNNKGKIWVESELKKGTTFYFTIPKVNPQKFKQAS